jgi:hypothetical protein
VSYFDHFSLPMPDAAVVILSLAVGMAGLGVAITYVVGDPRSSATRALAFSVAALYPSQHVLTGRVVDRRADRDRGPGAAYAGDVEGIGRGQPLRPPTRDPDEP